MRRYLLDTNTVSHLLRAHPAVSRRVASTPMNLIAISAITEAEIHFGLAKRPQAKALHIAVRALLHRVEILPWDSQAAAHYGLLRANGEKQGKVLAPLDLMIAAHAYSLEAVLVSNDQAFKQVDHLRLEDWTLT